MRSWRRLLKFLAHRLAAAIAALTVAAAVHALAEPPMPGRTVVEIGASQPGPAEAAATAAGDAAAVRTN